MNTNEVLKSMLVERTGIALCDSGGQAKYDKDGKYIGSEYGYGRNYERNAGLDFGNLPAVELSFRRGEIEFTHNVYHWLSERLTYNDDYTEAYQQFSDKNEDWTEFPEWLGKREGIEACGIYGDGGPIVVNTYNHESMLSQVILFVYFTFDKQAHILLKIHGGCDVRGGYTEGRVFDLDKHDETCIFYDAHGTIYCDKDERHPSAVKLLNKQNAQEELPGIEASKIDFDEEHHWSTDDAYNWYSEECGECNLEDYPTKDLSSLEEENPGEWEPGKLCFDGDVGYCPICGGKLNGQ